MRGDRAPIGVGRRGARHTEYVGGAVLLVAACAVLCSYSPAAIAAPLAAPMDQGLWQQAWQWILASQRDALRGMRNALVAMRGGDVWSGGTLLVALAFAYGIIHALGPGHGKAVITSYALANGETIRRSVIVSFMAALIQAGSAIVLVLVGMIILAYTARNVMALETPLEVASGALIALCGVYLLYRHVMHTVRSRWARREMQGTDVESKVHCEDDCSCGHVHIVEPQHVAGPWSWRSAWLLALSVGVRPCTGALLLLVFARSQNMIWAGVAGTFAMALGTAATVSALAMVAVGSREWAIRVMAPTSMRSEVLRHTLMFAAGLALVGLGAAMVFSPPPKSPF